jgi:YD repeat-containing protein
MPVYSFKSLLASLNIQDTPVGYTPPVGPAVKTTITYNQREANQPTTFDYFNVGHKWTLNWLTYIQDDPAAAGSRVLRYVAGGGGETYSGYNASTHTFAPEEDNGAQLQITSSNPITYELSFADGSKDIFSVSDGKTAYPRKVFLSRIVDARGNALTLTYDTERRLSGVTDALGRQTTFQYEDDADPLLLTGIADPFGRSAKLTYDSQGRLSAITDAIGLTSTFAYDSGTFIESMTTPYGTTTFAHTEGVGGSTELSIQATDPNGNTERTEYRPGAPGVPYSVAQVPSGMSIFNAYLNYRDSFYWDKDAYAAACTQTSTGVSCDYSKARLKHFEHEYPCCEYTSRVLESIKYPLEGMIWYDYAGQPTAYYPGTLSKPSHIGRVLPDGSTQLTTYAYNAFGRVTKHIDPLGRETEGVE